MPKKAHGRQAKQKSRSRRPTSTAQTAAPAVDEEYVSAGAAAPVAPAATTAARPASTRPAAAPRPGAARRSPTITVNYAYLHHDLVSLGILGPAMIALLIIAYLIFHGA